MYQLTSTSLSIKTQLSRTSSIGTYRKIRFLLATSRRSLLITSSCLNSSYKKLNNKSYLKSWSTSRQIPAKNPNNGKPSWTKIKQISIEITWDLTTLSIQRMNYWRKNRMRRKKCQEWEETRWREQQLTCPLSQIGISRKRRCAETVKTRIMHLAMSARHVNYHFS